MGTGENYEYTGSYVVDDDGRPLGDETMQYFCMDPFAKGDKIFWNEESGSAFVFGG